MLRLVSILVNRLEVGKRKLYFYPSITVCISRFLARYVISIYPWLGYVLTLSVPSSFGTLRYTIALHETLYN